MIASPDLSNSRSRLADWLELRALFANQGAGEADFASVSRLTSDDHRDRQIDETGVAVEDEILEGGIEETMICVSEEIGQRVRYLENDYPFIVTERPFRISLKGCDYLTTSHWTYLFLLLMSGERDRMLPKSDKIANLIRTGRTLFHACASIGVAGLLRNATTIWFGWPRPDGAEFLPALAKLCDKLGCGRAKDHIPAGLPSRPKDDHIDIVGWRTFRDQRNGNLLVLCQAATGNNWNEKSVINHIEAFRDWFDLAPYARAMGSIALPFPAYHEVDEHPEEDFRNALHNSLHRSQSRHGVLIDRFRIVESVVDVNADSRGVGRVNGIEKLAELKVWVSDTIEAIKGAG